MSIIIEDGSCVPFANSFVTLDETREYWRNRIGGDHWGEESCLSDIELYACLISAADIISEMRFKYSPSCCDNTLPFPLDLCGYSGRISDKAPVPLSVKHAQIIIAEGLSRGLSFQSVSTSGVSRVKEVKLDGFGTIEYEGSFLQSGPESRAAGILARVCNMLSPYLQSRSSVITVKRG